MANIHRKVNLYIAMSLDGYIATEDDNIDFLSQVEVPNEDYGYAEFTSGIDTVIWGRKTYDKVLSFGGDFHHKDKKVWVLSNSRTGKDENVEYFSDLPGLIKKLQAEPGKGIYCDGGAELVFELLNHSLIDRLIVSVIPHLLGGGIRLFKDGRPEQSLVFKRSLTFPSGLVQLWYDKKENKKV
jgi:dihydrofolate reductase